MYVRNVGMNLEQDIRMSYNSILTKEQKEISYHIKLLKERQKHYYNKWHELDMKINILKIKKANKGKLI